MDEIAGDAIDDIFRATLEESLQSIANRSSALDGYIRDIQAVTQTANRQASLISLETPRTIAVGLTEVMGEIKSIKQAFEDNEESGEEITKRVDTITAGLKKLRDIMDDLT